MVYYDDISISTRGEIIMMNNSLETTFLDEPNISKDTKVKICKELKKNIDTLFEGKCKIIYHNNAYEAVTFNLDGIFRMELYFKQKQYFFLNEEIRLFKCLALNNIEISNISDRGKGGGQQIIALLEKAAMDYGYMYFIILVVISDVLEHILEKNDYSKREGSSVMDVGFDYYKKLSI